MDKERRMKSFGLFEGLIKAPPNIYKDFRAFALGHALLRVSKDWNTRKAKAILKKISQQFHVKIPTKQLRDNHFKWPHPHTDLPPQYQHDEIDDDPDYLRLNVSNQPSRDRADYDPENWMVTIYLATYVDEVLGLVDDESDLQVEVTKMCHIIETDVKHELMHYVQDISLQYKHAKQNKGQVGNKKKDYFLAPQEFDPTIRSEIGEFQARVKRPYSPSKIKEFTSQSEFFKVLKKHDPKRYKIAMKKFGTEIGK